MPRSDSYKKNSVQDIQQPALGFVRKIGTLLNSALAAVLSAAIVYSFVPITIDTTIATGNPFIYNALSRTAVVFLAICGSARYC